MWHGYFKRVLSGWWTWLSSPLGLVKRRRCAWPPAWRGEGQAVCEQVVTGKFVFGEPSVVVEHTQGMHDAVKSFMETDFASYLRLGELDMEGLRQLCRDQDAKGDHPEGDSSKTRPSSNPPGGLCWPPVIMCPYFFLLR
ncbi:unnamed protein product [Lactuca virosa]|uniref:Uncharacterized protein n=1 Tax=Lactuca virosa TaxID=75947 RepID=A0AAU9MQU1_9ASTR|nr:unnamed protein product [Lactuca virosa]